MQDVPRRLHRSHDAPTEVVTDVQETFALLHSQQLLVPFRTLRRFTVFVCSWCADIVQLDGGRDEGRRVVPPSYHRPTDALAVAARQ
jgi:hypothetical protein